jgi:hypothetical protein
MISLENPNTLIKPSNIKIIPRNNEIFPFKMYSPNNVIPILKFKLIQACIIML